MPSVPHTLVWAHPQGPWSMPLPEAHALSPWQGHPTGMRPLPVAVGSTCLGVQNVGGGFERALPQGRTPTPAVFPLARQEVKNSERREAKDVGLTVVVDARKQPPPPVLFSALRSVQVRQALCARLSHRHARAVPAWEGVLPPFGGPSEPPLCPLSMRSSKVPSEPCHHPAGVTKSPPAS